MIKLRQAIGFRRVRMRVRAKVRTLMLILVPEGARVSE